MKKHPEVSTRVDLAKYCGKLGYKVGAEIGVCKGKFSRVFCWNVPDIKLYCIDTWESDIDDPGDEGELNEANYAHAKRILSPFDTIFIRKNSMEALEDFKDGSLDFVYIDGNHTFDYIMIDLIEWSKKVRKGGIVSGHDYFRLKNKEGFQKFDVILAVDTYIEAHNIVDAYIIDGDHTPSYFWIKT